MEKELTLTSALALKVKTEDARDDIDRLLAESAKDQSYRGEPLEDMNANRMLYFVGTHEAMERSAKGIIAEYELDDKQAEALFLSTKQTAGADDAVECMRESIVFYARKHILTQEIKALNEYIKEFDEADFKKIRKKEKLEALKDLGLI